MDAARGSDRRMMRGPGVLRRSRGALPPGAQELDRHWSCL